MKTIYKDEYQNDGIFIDLDVSNINYEDYIADHDKYLNKDQTYYFYCYGGVKSTKVVAVLETYGYKVVKVINC